MNLPLILLLLCLSSSFCINLERTDEPKYNIVIATSRDKVVGDLTGQEVPMTLQGVEYRCFLPQEEAEEETPLLDLDATPSPREFLEPLASQCLYRSTGWWTYELCHGKHIRQFHQERDLPIRPQDDFVLGKQVADDKQQYVITKLTSEDMKAPGKDYYAELYNFGTPCDLTTLQRQAEVRWFCTPDKTTTSIFDIREPASCTYVISVSTPHICKHPAFAVKREKTLSVTCIPLNEDSVLPKLKEPKIVKKEEKPQEQKQQQQQPPQQQGQEQQEMVFYVTVDELINQLGGDNTELQEHILQQVTEQLQFIQQDEKQEELSEEDDTSRNKKRDVN